MDLPTRSSVPLVGERPVVWFKSLPEPSWPKTLTAASTYCSGRNTRVGNCETLSSTLLPRLSLVLDRCGKMVDSTSQRSSEPVAWPKSSSFPFANLSLIGRLMERDDACGSVGLRNLYVAPSIIFRDVVEFRCR